ncbi:MAG: hypothetical protein AB7S44_00905 [Spirochaetales bacterium]
MKRIFSVLLLILFASISMLSGCDLVSINEAKYYSTVVMTVGDTEITKEELINRYNSIADTYSSENYTSDKLMQITIDSIINRELILEYAKTEMGELSQYDQNAVWQEVYDYINGELKDLEDEIKVEWNIVSPTEATSEDTSVSYDTFAPYEPTVTMVSGDIVKVAAEADPVVPAIGDFVRENYNTGLENSVYIRVQNEAWTRYIRTLKNSESWKNLSTDSDEVFARELTRLYDIYEGNKYISNFEEYYNNNLTLDTVANRAVLDKYIELVQDSFATYSIDMDAYNSAMASDASSVYYHPNSGNEYIYVSHILIPYSDEQTALISDIEDRHDKNIIDDYEYNLELAQVANQISGKERDENGVEFGESKSASQILTEIQNALAAVGNDVEARAEIFNEFIYKYNTDSGMFNAETPYVVNLDTNVTDQMVAEFADASRALYYEGEGSMSGLVLTDYGYHIIFYSYPVQNIVDYNDLLNIDALALYNTKLSAGLEKNMYQKIYDMVTVRSYDDYQTGLINQLRSEANITIYETRYQDLLG